jgi:hypothetical protein
MFDFARNSRRALLTVSLTLVIVLMTFTLAYAAFFSINTDDGLIDPNWPAAPFMTDPAGDAASIGNDIINFWFGSDGNPPSEFYFRADLAPAVPPGNPSAGDGGMGPLVFLIAKLDCDNNGSFVDDVDMWVVFNAYKGETISANGSLSLMDQMPNTYGEFIGTTAFEWKTSTSGINLDWGPCTSSSQINVMLTTVDGIFTDLDTTTPKGYNVPTAITLQHLDGAAVVQPGAALALAGILGLVGLAVVRSARRKA